MTEYEMTDIIMSRFSNMTEQASLYFALVSGYLITAYLIGGRLTRLQVSVVNGLFILWTVGIASGYNTSVAAVVELETAIGHLNSRTISDNLGAGALGSGNALSAHLFTIVQLIGIIASLVFMWSVRHPKTK